MNIESETVEQALREACSQWGVTREEIEYTLDREHLRSGASTIRMEVRRKDPRVVQALAFGRDFLGGLLQRAGIEGEVQTQLHEGKLSLSIQSEQDGNLLIGRDGRTLEALQHLVSKAGQRVDPDLRVTVDVEDYRERREEGIREMALDAAHEARRFRKAVTLRPMNSYERRIVHMEVSKIEGVSSESVGEGHFKRMQIFPAARKGSSE